MGSRKLLQRPKQSSIQGDAAAEASVFEKDVRVPVGLV